MGSGGASLVRLRCAGGGAELAGGGQSTGAEARRGGEGFGRAQVDARGEGADVAGESREEGEEEWRSDEDSDNESGRRGTRKGLHSGDGGEVEVGEGEEEEERGGEEGELWVPCNAELVAQGASVGGSLAVDFGGKRIGTAVTFGGFAPRPLKVGRSFGSEKPEPFHLHHPELFPM